MSDPASCIRAAARELPKVTLATLPTPLEAGPELPGGIPLLVKRDDLTGLGMGGNKARKLELTCGAASVRGVDTVVTVGAAQSNHARMTAAACGRLGWQAHLVVGGGESTVLAQGNQLLARLFGARIYPLASDDWDALDVAASELASHLDADGRRVESLPMGGSTPVGAVGYLLAWAELMEQCAAAGLTPAAVVMASSTAGTHAGLLAGQAVYRAAGAEVPDVVAVGVAKRSQTLAADAMRLAAACLEAVGLDSSIMDIATAEVDDSQIGPGYAVPTAEGDAAIRWAARRGGWVLDRVYTGKAFAGLLHMAADGRFSSGPPVVFWHTGGQPALFASGGAPKDDDSQ